MQSVALSESASRPLTWKRLDGIDLLRGLSIFFVMMNHINIRLLGADVPYTRFLPAQLVHILVWNAQLGVQMFFAISGFLITSITIRRWGSLSPGTCTRMRSSPCLSMVGSRVPS